MSEEKKAPGRPKQARTFDTKQEVRCFVEDKELFKAAAKIKKTNASELVRSEAIKAAKRIIKKHQGKYTDGALNPKKRLNTLRDIAAESLGFLHGGYQQLMDYWRSQEHYNFLGGSGLYCAMENAQVATIATPVFPALLSALSASFPCNEKGLTGACTSSDSGWSLDGDFTIAHRRQDKGEWFPLYWGAHIVGFAYDSGVATVINGMILGARRAGVLPDSAQNLPFPTEHHPASWVNYLSLCVTQEMESRLLIGLRAEEMDVEILIPSDRVFFTGLELTVRATDSRNNPLFKVSPTEQGNKSNLVDWWLGNHIAAYAEDGSGHMTFAECDAKGRVTDCNVTYPVPFKSVSHDGDQVTFIPIDNPRITPNMRRQGKRGYEPMAFSCQRDGSAFLFS